MGYTLQKILLIHFRIKKHPSFFGIRGRKNEGAFPMGQESASTKLGGRHPKHFLLGFPIGKLKTI